MGRGPESERVGASGHDAIGREIVFIPGPDYHAIHSPDALDTAAQLELKARELQGNARYAMLDRAHELLNHAIRSESQTI